MANRSFLLRLFALSTGATLLFGATGCSGEDAPPAVAAESFCGKVGGGSGTAPAMTSTIEADDAAILYAGRFDRTDAKGPITSAPAASATVRFDGTALSVHFQDEFLNGKKNYYDVIVDQGSECERRAKITPRQGVTEYPAVWGLTDGEHTATFVKRTESSIGKVTFRGFSFRGDVLEAPEPPARRVQIIGDSISCGGGNDTIPKEDREEGQTFESMCMEDDWGVPYHNAGKAFGSLTARHFGAEMQVTAVSGIGLMRNYSSRYDARPMPEVYDTLFLEQMDSPPWNALDFVPDVVLIALGTNDLSPGEGGVADPAPRITVDEYVENYVAFIDHLMSDDHYPEAEFFALGSPMLGNNYPDSTYTYRDDLEEAIAAVSEHYASMGIDTVHAVPIHQTVNRGCAGHPGETEHADIANDDVIPAVAAVTGW